MKRRQKYLPMSPSHTRSHIYTPATFGERVSDRVVAAMGSWRFIIIQSVVVALLGACERGGIGFPLRSLSLHPA